MTHLNQLSINQKTTISHNQIRLKGFTHMCSYRYKIFARNDIQETTGNSTYLSDGVSQPHLYDILGWISLCWGAYPVHCAQHPGPLSDGCQEQHPPS